MAPPRLCIRVDVDVDHARQALANLPLDGRSLHEADLSPVLQTLRERLHRDIASAYPDARISVAVWPRSPKVRPTRVRVGFRHADGPTEARCALIREHVDSLRSAAISGLFHQPSLPTVPAPLADPLLGAHQAGATQLLATEPPQRGTQLTAPPLSRERPELSS